MRVMVTGGAGAIGRFVVEELQTLGHEPVVFSRQAPPATKVFAGVRSARGDVRNLDVVVAAIEENRVERVIHLAALLLESGENPYLGFQTNSLGGTTLFEATRRTGVQRVVYGSTKSVLGPLEGVWGHPTYRPVREDYRPKPQGGYGLTKYIAELTAEHYRKTFGLDVVIVRFGTTCGPWKAERHGSSRVPGTIIENAVLGVPTHVAQGGDQQDDIIFNRDLAAGLVRACMSTGLEHHVFHLGTGKLITLHDIARAVRQQIPEAQITIGPGVDYMGLGMGNYCLMSTARARRELGFETRPLGEWVADYIQVFRESGDST